MIISLSLKWLIFQDNLGLRETLRSSCSMSSVTPDPLCLTSVKLWKSTLKASTVLFSIALLWGIWRHSEEENSFLNERDTHHGQSVKRQAQATELGIVSYNVNHSTATQFLHSLFHIESPQNCSNPDFPSFFPCLQDLFRKPTIIYAYIKGT